MDAFDMLVRLYALPESFVPDEKMTAAGIRLARPMAADARKISGWIRSRFSEGWACEFEKSMCAVPAHCFIAVNQEKEIVGFSCYDATAKGFFGPIGVSEECRGLHVGKALLLRALHAMREDGYGYAAIGWVEEKNEAFYHLCAGAVRIPDSFPGVYRDSLLIL